NGDLSVKSSALGLAKPSEPSAFSITRSATAVIDAGAAGSVRAGGRRISETLSGNSIRCRSRVIISLTRAASDGMISYEKISAVGNNSLKAGMTTGNGRYL